MRATFTNTQIKAISTILPPMKIHIDSCLHSIYKGDEKALNRIKKVIGLNTRHIASKDISTTDLAFEAAKKLLDSALIDKNSIDALIFVTQTPDFRLPASACYLHGLLGLSTHCLSFDVNQACAGYVYGLYLAHSLIDSNAASNVLLIVGDTLSKYTNQADSNLAPIIGDGVSATLLSRSLTQNLAYFELGSDGSKFYQLIIPQGGSKEPTLESIPEPKIFETSAIRQLDQLYMDGAEIFNFALGKEVEAFRSIFDYAKAEIDTIDYFFLHQANAYIVNNIAKRLNLDSAKVPNETTNKYGNLSGCSVPATICDTLHNIKTNKDLSVLVAGFGAGLSWGNAILNLSQDFRALPIGVYEK